MTFLNILGGLFVMIALVIILGNILVWTIDTWDRLFHPAPPPTPPKVEWDEDKPHWNRKPDA